MAGKEGKSKIHWDDSHVNHVSADLCAVIGSMAEIYLLFGAEKTGDPSSVRLSDRVILSPFTAKQLSLALNEVIQEYEKKFGSFVKMEKSTPEERKRKGSNLFQLVKELDVAIGYEQSTKMQKKSMAYNRFLLGISKKEIGYKAHDRIINVCEQMEMPPRLLEIFRNCILDANYVHFGFEENQNTSLYKVYVEFWNSIREELKKSNNVSSKSYLMHLGFKWDAFNPAKQTIARYIWHPWLSMDEILDKVQKMCDASSRLHIIDAAKEMLSLSSARMPQKDILYLEVSEDNNPRKSFDINIYRGGFQVGEFYQLLTRMAQYYDISHGDFHHLYRRIWAKRFGHLSGGINREGEDFCTMYYGVEPLQWHQTSKTEDAAVKLFYPGGFEQLSSSKSTQPVEEADSDASILFNVIKALQAPYGFERSLKISHRTVYPDRFLVGLENKENAVTQEKIIHVCQQINMPKDFLNRFKEELPTANIVLWGFERNEMNRFYKAYLEHIKGLAEAFDAHPENPSPFLMFTGFKWDIANPSRKVITSYTCFPSYILRDIKQQASRLFSEKMGKESDRFLEGILDLASHRAGPRDFLYYEAEEIGNDRKSFSINLYRAGLKMAEAYPLLLDIARYFDIDMEEFHRIYKTTRYQILGNIAGGIDREGNDFITLYFSKKLGFYKQSSGI